MELSKKDRIILRNQFRILEKLYPNEAKSYSNFQEILERGYCLNYSDFFEWIFDEMSEEICRLVWDILAMYSALHFSYSKLKDKKGIEPTSIKFDGFDGNNETKFMAYTRFIIYDLGRYDELRYGEEKTNFNSHIERLDKYRNMLAMWRSCSSKRELTKEEILQITNL